MSWYAGTPASDEDLAEPAVLALALDPYPAQLSVDELLRE